VPRQGASSCRPAAARAPAAAAKAAVGPHPRDPEVGEQPGARTAREPGRVVHAGRVAAPQPDVGDELALGPRGDQRLTRYNQPAPVAADGVDALAEWGKNGPSDLVISAIVMPTDVLAPAPRAD